MISCAGAAGHEAGHQDAADIIAERGLVTEVFERFRIAFTDHFGIRISVKDPDQLPGISVADTAICCCVIIGDKITDLLHISAKFVFIGRTAVF